MGRFSTKSCLSIPRRLRVVPEKVGSWVLGRRVAEFVPGLDVILLPRAWRVYFQLDVALEQRQTLVRSLYIFFFLLQTSNLTTQPSFTFIALLWISSKIFQMNRTLITQSHIVHSTLYKKLNSNTPATHLRPQLSIVYYHKNNNSHFTAQHLPLT